MGYIQFKREKMFFLMIFLGLRNVISYNIICIITTLS